MSISLMNIIPIFGVLAIAALLYFIKRADQGSHKTSRKLHRSKIAENFHSSYRAFTYGVAFILEPDVDFGYGEPDELGEMLQHKWGVSSSHGLVQKLHDLWRLDSAHPAWEMWQIIALSRAGAGAGLIDQNQSWKYCYKVCQRLQQDYDSWAALSDDLFQGFNHRQPLEQHILYNLDKIRKNISYCGTKVWPKVPFAQKLAPRKVPKHHHTPPETIDSKKQTLSVAA